MSNINKEEWSKTKNETLLAIATQAKRLLMSDEIIDATPEVMNLCELIECFEENYCEIEPSLKYAGKKPWYASFNEKGQVANLREIESFK